MVFFGLMKKFKQSFIAEPFACEDGKGHAASQLAVVAGCFALATTRLRVKNPDHRPGLLLKEKLNILEGSRPQATLAIHPRAQHGAFRLFHVKTESPRTMISHGETP